MLHCLQYIFSFLACQCLRKIITLCWTTTPVPKWHPCTHPRSSLEKIHIYHVIDHCLESIWPLLFFVCFMTKVVVKTLSNCLSYGAPEVFDTCFQDGYKNATLDWHNYPVRCLILNMAWLV